MDDKCDVCIVGAGLAGLNALFVASRYLGRDQKVVLIDRRPAPGGMWVDTYPYVRLHQPHPMFTAGDIEWTLNKEPSHLATRDEVLGHFAHCLDEIGNRISVDERYGWTLEADEETTDGVRITCRTPSGEVRVIEAAKLIKAYGFRVTPNDPLPLTSTRVNSVSPDSCDVRGGEIGRSDTPVWVVGGGKTAMDTAHALITRYPGREVNLVAGSGTMFSSREHFFPDGAHRWWGGTTVSRLAREISQRFDGTNEDDVAAWFRVNHGISLTPDCRNFLLGVLSESERRTIAAGLNHVIMDHVVDAVDRNGSTDLVLRSGATRSVQPGSWIVNCTGYITQGEHPDEPYMSASGSTVSINLRSATLHFSSYGGYFLTHLLFLGRLRDVPLYALDLQDLWSKSKPVLPYAMFMLAQHNLGLIADAVPARVFGECGLDFDRWYPWHRRMAGTARFMVTHRRERARQRRALDTIRDRFEVRCGPLTACAGVAG
ncbi:FAD-dependent oxidoreductase [Mycobacterium sp. Y57]|uniref:FAD-dependent oxidoreductase n=1 Tax=Mycolicibacterium xanthum TaxID=2796469 RepID=UPI001C851126|nr:FAD-dependent oxidoreductase [Mycolicibacterium xanthum]MBX7433518.1 FAD-dependent oxidoreductase [Mycolicibacterium xanthum]